MLLAMLGEVMMTMMIMVVMVEIIVVIIMVVIVMVVQAYSNIRPSFHFNCQSP